MFAQIHAENRSKLARKFIQHFKEKLLIAYRDFIPQQTVGRGFFSAAEYESFDAALRAANTFVETQSVKMLNVETVVLPNVWDSAEEGTTDASIRTSGDISSTWHQFIRVWYER
tara:strand:- start:4083 stop:4424 length:342 start_codon:yes stop_codon:yes gene_type:complete